MVDLTRLRKRRISEINPPTPDQSYHIEKAQSNNPQTHTHLYQQVQTQTQANPQSHTHLQQQVQTRSQAILQSHTHLQQQVSQPQSQTDLNNQEQSQHSSQQVEGDDIGEDVLGIDENKVVRHRGPTLLKDVWNMSDDEVLVVEWNKDGQPVGREGGLLGQFLGTIARNGSFCPLTFTDWRKMPKTFKRNMLETVQLKFDLGTKDHSRWIFESINSKWRNWKSDLKAQYFEANKTQEELLRNVPKILNPDQWTSLVQFWFSEEGKKRSNTNKINRSKQSVPHSAGQKSFARIRREKEIETKKELDRASLYIITHQHKNGEPVDDVARDRIKKINQLKSKPSTSQCTSEGSFLDADIYSQAVGKDKRGRIRGLGLGLPKSSASQQLEEVRMNSEQNRKKSDEEIHFLKNKVEMMASQMNMLLSTMRTLQPGIQMTDFENSRLPSVEQVHDDSSVNGELQIQRIHSSLGSHNASLFQQGNTPNS